VYHTWFNIIYDQQEDNMALAFERVIALNKLGMHDLPKVGGKNASLGELISHLAAAGVQVPGGFATTAQAYEEFIAKGDLNRRILAELEILNVDHVNDLVATGEKIRQWIIDTSLPAELEKDIRDSYQALCVGRGDVAVAVRSSATAEDLPDASFAGQQETFLNITGIDNVLLAVKRVYASLFNDRAIAYRVHQGFDHGQVAISAGIQLMVRSDLAASGVMFTLDTESGFDQVVFITSSYGLGECVVQGTVNPDEFYVHKGALAANRPAILRRNVGSKLQKMIYSNGKHLHESVAIVPVDKSESRQFSLTDNEIEQLARYAMAIEKHYGRPMDIEWAKDGNDQQLYILQARPETVKSRDNQQTLRRYALNKRGTVCVEGRAIGQRIGQGVARVIKSIHEMDKVQPGDVLIADMTDPDWEPIMKRASAIVTNRGGRTCHAAIIAREMGIPAVVGCGDATKKIAEGELVTVSCAEGDTGFVYKGELGFSINELNVQAMPALPFAIMMNVANPERAFDFCKLPNEGIGLARLEFIINRMIGIHPKALLEFDSLSDVLKTRISELTAAYSSPVEFYVQRLAEGISTLAAAFYPKKVIVRLSDFKSNEYANLIGGDLYEPHEENPMIGFRGASRYVADSFRDCFALECRALKHVRDVMGFDNIQVMVPFVRTPEEGRQVIKLLAENGLKRGENGLKVIMMCELPSNALLAETFLRDFDGFSIGSNDLTQLTLGLDRDSALVANQFDERDPAVKALLHLAISACKKEGKYIGICGQGPSDHPDFAQWLMQEGIDSVSLNPDCVVETWLYLTKEKKAQ